MRDAGLETVLAAIEGAGLVARGALRLSDSERTGALADVRTIVLAGFVGRNGWDAFARRRARHRTDQPHPRRPA